MIVCLGLLACLAVPSVFAADVTYKMFQDNGSHFMMDIPADFTFRPTPRPEMKVAAVKPEGRVCIQVVSEPVQGKLTKKNRTAVIRSWGDSVAKQLKKDKANSSIDSGTTSLAGHQAAYISYVRTFDFNNEKIPLYVEKYMIEANDCYYIITNSVEAGAANTYKPVFTHCIQSFLAY
jgi:hypothetical protein